MSLRTIIPVLALAASLAACSTPTTPATTGSAPGATIATATTATTTAAATLSVQERNKRNAIAFYNEFFNQHDLSAAERYLTESYIQHNPGVPNGRAPFVQTFSGLFKKLPQRRSTIYRALADGNLVALHVGTVTSPTDRGVAIVDIFRFDDDGKIAEHWDVIQPVPEKTASGNSMF